MVRGFPCCALPLSHSAAGHRRAFARRGRHGEPGRLAYRRAEGGHSGPGARHAPRGEAGAALRRGHRPPVGRDDPREAVPQGVASRGAQSQPAAGPVRRRLPRLRCLRPLQPAGAARQRAARHPARRERGRLVRQPRPAAPETVEAVPPGPGLLPARPHPPLAVLPLRVGLRARRHRVVRHRQRAGRGRAALPRDGAAPAHALRPPGRPGRAEAAARAGRHQGRNGLHRGARALRGPAGPGRQQRPRP